MILGGFMTSKKPRTNVNENIKELRKKQQKLQTRIIGPKANSISAPQASMDEIGFGVRGSGVNL